MEAIYHSGSLGEETGVIFLHGLQTNEVDRKWMATFGSERPGARGAAMAAQAVGGHVPSPGPSPQQRVGDSLDRGRSRVGRGGMGV